MELTVRLRARVLAATRRRPPDGTTQWSRRRLAVQLGVDKNIVRRVWREADLRPHWLAPYRNVIAAVEDRMMGGAASAAIRRGIQVSGPRDERRWPQRSSTTVRTLRHS